MTTTRHILEAIGREGYTVTLDNQVERGVRVTAQDSQGDTWSVTADDDLAAAVELARVLGWEDLD